VKNERPIDPTNIFRHTRDKDEEEYDNFEDAEHLRSPIGSEGLRKQKLARTFIKYIPILGVTP